MVLWGEHARGLRLVALGWALSSLSPTPASAQVSIDFTEVAAGTGANGLTIDGVSFEYFVNGVLSPDAAVRGGPGCLTFVCDPSLEGGATTNSLLRMTFASPLQFFQFGLAASLGQTLVSVSTFDPFGGFLAMSNLVLTNLVGFPEAQFTSGPEPLGSVAVALSQGERFAVDNITATVVSVPEPAMALLLVPSLLGMAVVARRRNAMPEA